jgi:thiamine phosphate synthase YjbQ (UPF0047 family)
MSGGPSEIRFRLAPQRRFQAFDVSGTVASEHGDVLKRHRRALYCSLHTTAGYLDPSLAARLEHHPDHLARFFDSFRRLFPENGGYRHDQLEERAELSEAQKKVEPKNGDSHLTFIGSGMRNCVTYRNQPPSPVYFIDLDGTHNGSCRERKTVVLAYDEEEVVARKTVDIPVSRHPIDSINLGDPRLGVIDLADELLAQAGLEKGRVDIVLGSEERGANLTVNEYETLLMQHDLVEVLRNPFKFAALGSRHILDDPLALPSKTINYAKYDAVRVLNSLMEALGLQQSVVERLVAKVMAVPARRFLRFRRISFLASDEGETGRAALVRGTYQNPILVQWQPAEHQTRRIEIAVVRLA